MNTIQVYTLHVVIICHEYNTSVYTLQVVIICHEYNTSVYKVSSSNNCQV